jgi:hypothetical protein
MFPVLTILIILAAIVIGIVVAAARSGGPRYRGGE